MIRETEQSKNAIRAHSFGVRLIAREREVIKRKKNINLTRAKYAIMQNIYNTPLREKKE